MVRQKDQNRVVAILAFLLVIGMVVAFWIGSGGSFALPGQDAPIDTDNCPTDGDTSLTFTVRNFLNESGLEQYDNTVLVYKVSDGAEALFTSGTDSTSGAYTLDCGYKYRVRIVSSDSDGGDGSKLMNIDAGDGASLGANGEYVEFDATSGNYLLEVAAKQHGTVEFRGFDVNNNDWLYDDQDKSDGDNDYETTGLTFLSTANGTEAIGAGGDIHFKFDIRNTEAVDDTDFADYSLMFCVDAANNKYDVPTLIWNGKTLSKTTLDEEESLLISGTYEHCFGSTEGTTRAAKTLDFQIAALSGVNPGASDDLVIAMYARGGSRQVAGNEVRVSAATDASSPAAVYTAQSFTIDVS